MDRKIIKILKELKENLKNIYGKKLKDLILYGSWARNEATPDSDIDVSVIIDDEIIQGREIDRVIEIIYEINLAYNVLISIYPVSLKMFEKTNSPLLLNIKKEGIKI